MKDWNNLVEAPKKFKDKKFPEESNKHSFRTTERN